MGNFERTRGTMTRLGTLVLAALLGVLSCKTNEECTKARLEASDAWRDVEEKASNWKLQGGVGYEDFDQRQKAEHYRIWNSIGTSAEEIWKAFAFEKITWTSADRARQQANKDFQSYWAAEKYASFKGLLDRANNQYENTAKKCR